MSIVKEISILPYIFISAAIVFSIRLFPFIVFKDEASVPSIVKYIGKYLPPAIVAGIVIYCLKAIDFTVFPFGLWEIIAIAAVALLHLWKKNMLISIFAGTIIYMLLIQNFTA